MSYLYPDNSLLFRVVCASSPSSTTNCSTFLLVFLYILRPCLLPEVGELTARELYKHAITSRSDSTSDNHAHADVSAQSLSIHGSDNSVVLDVDSALEVAVALGEGSQSLAEKPEDAAEFEDTIESTSAAEHEDAFEGSAAEDSDAVGGEANAQIVSLDRYLRVFDSALHRKP
jgi:hypothetical protein